MGDSKVVKVEVKAIFPTNAGCAVFLGDDHKVFVIYVDPAVGSAIAMNLRKMNRERPQTHDLIANVLTAIGARVERVVINNFHDGVFYARLIIVTENELQHRKIIELDARPSDSLALALQKESPIYVASNVWEEMEDMSEVLNKMEDRSIDLEDEADEDDDEDE